MQRITLPEEKVFSGRLVEVRRGGDVQTEKIRRQRTALISNVHIDVPHEYRASSAQRLITKIKKNSMEKGLIH